MCKARRRLETARPRRSRNRISGSMPARSARSIARFCRMRPCPRAIRWRASKFRHASTNSSTGMSNCPESRCVIFEKQGSSMMVGRGMVKTSLAVLLVLASCAKPPQTAYDSQTGNSATAASLPVGQNAAGESCTIQRNGGNADVYCGSWDQPSAHAQTGGPATASDLTALASTSAWRASLEGGYACNAPSPTTILNGVPAEVLSCTQRFGGWPHVALVSVIDGTAYYADGVLPALPPMQRTLGVLSGKISAGDASRASVAASDQILARRLAAQAFSSGDIGHYDALMVLAAKANQAEDFPSAIIAYRAALALQQKKIGADNPGAVAPMLELALNLSDQAQYSEAVSIFTAAAKLAPASSDPTAEAKLLHYQGLDALNQNNPQQALPLLRQAERLYATLLPSELLHAKPVVQTNGALFSISTPPGVGELLSA